MKPPCTGHPVFISPQNHTPEQILDAVEMCQHCPLITDCATQALTGGTTINHQHTLPTSGVIQAGVVCNGDQPTAIVLASIAHKPIPLMHAQPKPPPPRRCKGCGEIMGTRDRRKSTAGAPPTHSSGGYCRRCDAKRRRQAGWVSKTPKYTTIL